jgi:hypothetical protein
VVAPAEDVGPTVVAAPAEDVDPTVVAAAVKEPDPTRVAAAVEDSDPEVVAAAVEDPDPAVVPGHVEDPDPAVVPGQVEDPDPTVVTARSPTPSSGGAEEAATLVAPMAEATMASVEAEATSRATIPPSSALHPMLLERVEPSLGRGERLRLDAAHWHVRIGRAEHNEIRLYTASASRDQAEIRGNERGEWILTPAEGKTLLVDGDVVDAPIELEVGMNLVMGGDHLRCVTEGLDRSEMTAQTAAEGLADGEPGRAGGLGWMGWATVAIAGLGIAMLVYAWFGA